MNTLPYRILCAGDMTSLTPTVLAAAVQLAYQSKTPLTILLAYRLLEIDSVSGVTSLRQSIEATAMSKYTSLTTEIMKDRLIPYEFVTEIGFISDRITKFMRHHRVGMLVVGDSFIQGMDDEGGTGFQEFMKRMALPVMVVPESSQPDNFLNELSLSV